MLAGLAVFLLAAAIRLTAVVNAGADADPMGYVDQSEYLTLAQNLVLHDTLSYGRPYHWGDSGALDAPGPYRPTAARPPLYPAFIALFWWNQAPPILAVRIAQSLLGAAVALLVFLIADRAFGWRTAIVAGTAMALAPASVMLAIALFSESLFIFLLTLGVWLWGRRRGAAAGIAFGLATLCRPVLLPLIALVALAALVFRFNRALHLRIVLCAVLVLAPWTVRNAITQHAFIPVSTLGWGANVFLGTIDTSYGKDTVWTASARDPAFTSIIATQTSEVDAERRLFAAGVARIVDTPLHWLWVRLKQYPRLFIESPSFLYPLLPVPTLVIRAGYLLGTIAFVALALTGAVATRREWRESYFIAAFPAYLLIAQFPVLTDERYGLPMVPMLVVYAAVTLSRARNARMMQ